MAKKYSLESIHELSGGDEEFTAILVQAFLEEIPTDLQNMVTAVASDDPKAAYQCAHKMKPNLQSFGIDLLKQIKQVESWSKKNTAGTEIQPVVNHIEETITNAIKELRADFE